MESTRQKTVTQSRTLLSVAAVLTFILLICPALSGYGQHKVIRITDGDTIKLFNNRAAPAILSVVSENDGNYGTKNGILGLEIEGIFAVMEKWRW